MALLIVEGAVRVLHIGPRLGEVRTELFQLSEDPVLRYELRPSVDLGGIRINAEGMRDDAPEPGRRSIALIGDSIAFGYGADQSGTAASWMERILNESYATDQPFDVLNYGVTGYNITQDVRMLERRSGERDFEAVLLFYCLNDPQDYSFELEQLQSRLNVAQRDFLARDAGRWLARSRLWRLVKLQLAQRSARGQQRGGVRPEPDWASLRTPSWARYFIDLHRAGPHWDRVTQGFADLADYSRMHDVPVYVVIFPVMKDLENYPLTPVHDRVGAAAEEAGLRWVDLGGLFRALRAQSDEAGIFDELHPDAVGYALAALATTLAMLRDGGLGLAARDLAPVTSAEPPLGAWAKWVQGLASPN